ncbi:MAG: redox-active protein [Planctomycetia bacterium]|nr:redox-active protein [Planctomycetia bacterium]
MELTQNAINTAQSVFHQAPNHYNCAQAVVSLAGRDDLVPPFKAFGGGRAEGGLCGALYGALAVTPESEHERIKQEFAATAGALTCKEIKSANKTPCANCVALGALLAGVKLDKE